MDRAEAARIDADDYLVFRARIGVRAPQGVLAPPVLEEELTMAIADVVCRSGATLQLLQIGLSVDPDWAHEGPSNRASRSRGHEQDHDGAGHERRA